MARKKTTVHCQSGQEIKDKNKEDDDVLFDLQPADIGLAAWNSDDPETAWFSRNSVAE